MRREKKKRDFEEPAAFASFFLSASHGCFPFLDLMIYPFYREPEGRETDQPKERDHSKE